MMEIPGKQTAKMSNWSIEYKGTTYHLVGRVTEHPKLESGTQIVTSRLMWVSFDRMLAETKNTLYELK